MLYKPDVVKIDAVTVVTIYGFVEIKLINPFSDDYYGINITFTDEDHELNYMIAEKAYSIVEEKYSSSLNSLKWNGIVELGLTVLEVSRDIGFNSLVGLASTKL